MTKMLLSHPESILMPLPGDFLTIQSNIDPVSGMAIALSFSNGSKLDFRTWKEGLVYF